MARFLFVAALVLSSGCAPAIEDDATPVEHEADELVDGRFAFEPGYERLHRDPNADDAANQRSSLHLGNAYWLSRLSDYAYWGDTTIRQQLQNIRFTVREFRSFSNTCTGADALYLRTDTMAAVLFRGSDTLMADWVRTNGNSPKTEWEGRGWVHRGFRAQLDSLWNGRACNDVLTEGGSLREFVAARHGVDPQTGERRGGELYLAGHSMGGALATLFLARSQAETCARERACDRAPSIPISGVYSFGSPKTGEWFFSTSVAYRARNHTPYFRVVNGDDPATIVPRNLAPELTDYRHVGNDSAVGESSLQVWIKQPDKLQVSTFVPRFGWNPNDHSLPAYSAILKQLAQSRGQL